MNADIDKRLGVLLAAGKLREWEAAAIRAIITGEQPVVINMPRRHGRSAAMDMVTQTTPMETEGAPR